MVRRPVATIPEPPTRPDPEFTAMADADRSDTEAPRTSAGSTLNDQQRAAVEFDGEHCLVLAGAGTGKTTTIIRRVAHLIRGGADPSRMVMMTFTRRAAREMTHRLSRLSDSSTRVAAGTFHNFCLTYLRRWPKWFGTTGVTILDRDDQLQLMKLSRASRSEFDSLPKPAVLVNYISYARNTNQSIEQYLQKFTDLDEADRKHIAALGGIYHERKRECGYMDYDDILYHFASNLHQNEKLRAKLSESFDHILVDEMQDTNPLQWLILDGLRDPAKLFCVGDDAQSIYAFRGADFENVHRFDERVPASTTLKLEENYRSTQEILDLSNWLLDQSPLDYDKFLTAARGGGVRPAMHEFDSDFEEADWIVGDLKRRHDDGEGFENHMILTRTAFAARTVEATLIENDVPYRFIGGTTLLKSAHVKDLLSLLRVIDNPDDDLAWIRYLTLWPRVGDKTAAKLMATWQSPRRIDTIVEQLREKFTDKPQMAAAIAATADRWETATGAIAAATDALSNLLESKYDRWEIRSRDFELLVRLAGNHPTVADFIATYTLDPVSESEAASEDADEMVTLITVHSAKGTESPVCYLIGVEPGNYPHSRSVGSIDEEEEERRVLYVAMTRAMNELILTRTHRSGGAFVPTWSRHVSAAAGESYFLDSVPASMVDCQTHSSYNSGGPITPRWG